MTDEQFKAIFGLTEQEKQDMINAIADDTINALDDDNTSEFQDETEEGLI